MAFSIKSEKTDKLARKVARLTHQSLTAAVTESLELRLQGIERERKQQSLADRLNAFAKRFAALPDRDTRSADEILGYDEHGLPN